MTAPVAILGPATRSIFIAGPTGVGKSALALRLAQRLNGEIISVDSMQVYCGMDIGTAKPTLAERAQVPHHLIDVVGLDQSFDAAEFVQLACIAQAAIADRRRIPIFCGGTGLYFQAFLQGLGEAPPPDPEVRASLNSQALPVLLEELAQTDPDVYHRIDQANRRRVVRALEVIRLTGRPFSEQQARWDRRPRGSDERPRVAGPAFFGLVRTKEDLNRRISQRVERMFGDGLVAEVESLLAKGLAENPTARQGLGYKQVLAMIQGGPTLEATINLVKTKTRQYAKRQMTWFCHQNPGLEWINIQEAEAEEAVVERLVGKLQGD